MVAWLSGRAQVRRVRAEWYASDLPLVLFEAGEASLHRANSLVGVQVPRQTALSVFLAICAV